jgi:chloramphenicol 3-O-phosphotransferase
VRNAADLLARRAQAQVIEALEDTRVVVINGARQVGKSTLAEAILKSVLVVRLDTWTTPPPAAAPSPTRPPSFAMTAFC